MQVTSSTINDRCSFITIDTAKFKTEAVSVCIIRPLNKEEVTLNALLPMVLKRGCNSYPDTRELSRHMQELYDLRVGAGIKKKGDLSVITINFEFVSDKYLQGSILHDVTTLMRELVFEQQSFKSEYVENEKENLKKAIDAVINDKRAYAQERLVQTMCSGEPYGIPELGYKERVDEITAEKLYQHYRKLLDESNIYVYYCGSGSDAAKVREKLLPNMQNNTAAIPPHMLLTTDGEPRFVEEKDNITQAKLSIGFRTGVNCYDKDYHALVVMDNIFGGSLDSKLFLNVREKLSLCYYVYSRIERFKGTMYVNCGIERANFDVAKDEVLKQLGEIAAGNVSDEELATAKLDLSDGYNSLVDTQSAIIEYYLNMTLTDTIDNTIESFVAALNKVTKEQVVEVAKKIKPDTIFVLSGREE